MIKYRIDEISVDSIYVIEKKKYLVALFLNIILLNEEISLLTCYYYFITCLNTRNKLPEIHVLLILVIASLTAKHTTLTMFYYAHLEITKVESRHYLNSGTSTTNIWHLG